MTAPRFSLDAIEVHAEGEPGRIITNAAGLVDGATMAERFAFCRDHLDGLRRAILREPRGYPGLCAVFLLPPVNQGSDFGIVVLEQGGFTPMSGSNTMCAVTAAIETGIVGITGPETQVVIDTAIGTVRAIAHVDGPKVTAVTVANVPSWVVALDAPLQVQEFGEVRADIVFGGQFFVQARAADLGIELHAEAAKQITRAGSLLRAAAPPQFPVQHPENPDIDQVALTMLHGPSPTPGVSGRNAVVLPNGEVDLADPDSWTGSLDRSPCGTGTSGRMAALHARGELAPEVPFVHEGILGTTFTGAVRGTTPVGEREAVLPSISGRGWITGYAQLVLDDTDPFPQGYVLGDIWGPDATVELVEVER